MYPGVDPKRASILEFNDNVAHSNGNHGMKTYPTGYLPDGVQTFKGIKSYRNDGAGVFTHISGNIVIKDAFVADNRYMGIDIDRADNMQVVDTHIVGESTAYGQLIATQKAQPSCFRDALYGLELHTWKDRPENAGATIRNVTFSGFLNTNCSIAAPIYMDRTVRTGQFNYYTTFADVKVEEPRSAVDFCPAEEAGIVDVYLVDQDGSFRPSGEALTGATSTLVSNTERMLSFVKRERCNMNEAKCFSYCTNTCFRSVRFEIDPANTADFRLRVCAKDEPSNCIRINGEQRTFDDLAFNYTAEHRVFMAHLPNGEYDVVFVDIDGTKIWPSFVNVHYEEALCPTALRDGAITLIQPPTLPDECNALIRNGNFEESDMDPTYWTSRFVGIQLTPKAGTGGSNAISGLERKTSTTLSQYLDTRCLKEGKGRFYEIMADVKLELANGEQFTCDPSKVSCPEVGFFTGDSGYKPVAAELDPEINERGFQTFRTIVSIDDRLALAGEVRFDIKSNVDGKTMVVDNVSMNLVADEASYCENVIRTPIVEREQFWQVNDSGKLSIVQGPLDVSDASVPVRAAIRLSGRRDFDDGMEYDGWRPIEKACLKPQSQWRLSAQLQLVHRATGKGVACLDSKECPEIRVIVKDPSGNTVLYERYETHLANAQAFNWFKAELKLPTVGTWDGQIGNVIVDIRSFPEEYDLVVGAFVMNLVK